MHWTDPELADLTLDWSAFHTKWPQRSHTAYRVQRKRRPPAPSSLWDAYLALHDQVQQQFLLPAVATVSLPAQTIGVTFLSDLHIGGEGTDMRAIRRDFEQIAATDGLYLALGGDVADNFILKGMTSAAQSSDATVKIQWRLFVELMEIVKHKLIFVGSGNHDAWTWEVAQIDPILAHLKDLPCVYTGEGGLINLRLGEQNYRIFRKHRPNRGRNRNHPTNAVVEELHRGQYDFDIGILEHEHVPALLQFRYRQLDRIAIRTGTYKIRDAYAENLGFYESASASPTVILSPHEHRMIPFLHIADAMPLLCLNHSSNRMTSSKARTSTTIPTRSNRLSSTITPAPSVGLT